MRINQKGFAHLGIILGVLAALLIIAIGLFVYNSQSKDSKPSTTSENQESSDYLEIKEVGVKFKKPAGFGDLYYVYKDNFALISTKSLDALDPKCSADESSTAAISYFTNPSDPDPYSGTRTMAEAFPNAVDIDGKEFYVALSNGPCTLKDDGKLQTTVRNAMENVTIEKL